MAFRCGATEGKEDDIRKDDHEIKEEEEVEEEKGEEVEEEKRSYCFSSSHQMCPCWIY